MSDFLVRELRVGWDNFGWLTLGGFALLLAWRALLRSLEEEEVGESSAPKKRHAPRCELRDRC